jgi:hypothetical protein
MEQSRPDIAEYAMSMVPRPKTATLEASTAAAATTGVAAG